MPKSRKFKAELTLKGSQFYQTTISPSTSSTVATVAPSLFVRTLIASAIFEFYRFTRLTWKQYPSVQFTTAASASTSSVVACLSYYPEELVSGHTGTTISLVDASENEGASMVIPTVFSTNATPTLGTITGSTDMTRGRAPKRVLLNSPLNWYITDATGENDNVQQGVLIWAVGNFNSSSETTYMNNLFDYTVEFAGRSTTGLSLARKVGKPAMKEDDDEKSSVESLVVVKRSLGRPKAPSVVGPR
jgi:hypothetical protein